MSISEITAPVPTLQAQIVLRNASVRLGKRIVVDKVSLGLHAGTLIALVGPNGAGKTSLVKAIAGLLPVSGTLDINGQPLAKMLLAERARRIAWLPQGGMVHWPVCVREIVALGRIPFGRPGQRMDATGHAAVEQAIVDCCLDHLADRPATQLSGGERSRVLLARALASQAPILLADEPVAALDPAHQLAIMNVLRREADRGRLVICVLHDLTLAARFADRMIVLHRGAKVADGAPGAVLQAGHLDAVFGVRLHVGEVNGLAVVTMACGGGQGVDVG